MLRASQEQAMVLQRAGSSLARVRLYFNWVRFSFSEGKTMFLRDTAMVRAKYVWSQV